MLMTLVRINVIKQNSNDSRHSKNKVVPHKDYVMAKNSKATTQWWQVDRVDDQNIKHDCRHYK